MAPAGVSKLSPVCYMLLLGLVGRGELSVLCEWCAVLCDNVLCEHEEEDEVGAALVLRACHSHFAAAHADHHRHPTH